MFADTGGSGFLGGIAVGFIAGYIILLLIKMFKVLQKCFVGSIIADTGGSGFLGGIAAGFIAVYIILLLMKLFKGLPITLDGLKAIFLYPLFGILLTGAAMFVILGPMTTINEGMMSFLS